MTTFGSPRVGNSAFAQSFNSQGLAQSYRVVKSVDPATFVPLERSGFKHVDKEIYIQVAANQDLPPVDCDVQVDSGMYGSCSKRETAMSVAGRPTQLYKTHMDYLNVKFGTENCLFD